MISWRRAPRSWCGGCDEAPCRAGAPRGGVSGAGDRASAAGAGARGQAPAAGVGGGAGLWRKPWLWVGVVGAVGVGVVLAASLWPREPATRRSLDFHQFALGAR